MLVASFTSSASESVASYHIYDAIAENRWVFSVAWKVPMVSAERTSVGRLFQVTWAADEKRPTAVREQGILSDGIRKRLVHPLMMCKGLLLTNHNGIILRLNVFLTWSEPVLSRAGLVSIYIIQPPAITNEVL